MLQTIIRAISRSILKHIDETKRADDLKISNQIAALNQKIDYKINSVLGVIDDSNLDTLREIADQIKDDAKESRSLRSEMIFTNNATNAKIDLIVPVELQNKSMAEWTAMIEAIVAEEIASVKNSNDNSPNRPTIITDPSHPLYTENRMNPND